MAETIIKKSHTIKSFLKKVDILVYKFGNKVL